MGFRAASTGESNNGIVAFPVPAGSVAGDLLLVAVSYIGGGGGGTISTSAGTTFATRVTPTANGTSNHALWSAVLVGGDLGATITVDVNTSTRVAAIAWAEANAGVIDVAVGTAGASNSTTIPIQSVTPPGGKATDRHIVFYGGTDNASGVTNSVTTPTGGFTARTFVRSNHPSLKNANLAAAGRQLASAAATAAETSTATLTLAPSNIAVLVEPSNIAPTANAGPAQSVAPLSTVTLDGTGSTDPEAGALTYSWSQTAGPGVTLSSASASKPTFTAPADVNDVPLTFSLTVTDNLGQASSPSAVVVTVSAGPYLLRRQAGVWVRRKLLRRTGGAWVWP